ncbi:hypothetical protein [Streptomyces peucetius]
MPGDRPGRLSYRRAEEVFEENTRLLPNPLASPEEIAKRRNTLGGAGAPDESMLSMALHLRDQEMSLRDIAKRLVITTGAKEGRHPSPATVMRMLREHDEQTATAVSA